MKLIKSILAGALALTLFSTATGTDLARLSSESIKSISRLAPIQDIGHKTSDVVGGYVDEYVQSTPSGPINEEIYSGISSFNSQFTFNYSGSITPDQVLQEINSTLFGTYYSGMYEGLNVEIITNGLMNTSAVTVSTTYLHTKEQEDALNQAADSILAQITSPDMSDQEKIKAVYDYIAVNSYYGFGDGASLTESGVSVHSPYAIISDGYGVCQAYALLNYKMLEKSGIEVMYITGTASNGQATENHAWNLVKLDGQWYHSDPTWGDPYPDVPGRVHYDYYMKSDGEFEQTHTWDSSVYPAATGSLNTDFSFKDLFN